MSRPPPQLALRAAALRALRRLPPTTKAEDLPTPEAPIEAPIEASIPRISMEVTVGGRTELVSLFLREGELVYASSGEDPSRHIEAALQLLVGVEAETAAHLERGAFGRTSEPPPSLLDDILGEAEEGDSGGTASPALSRLAEALDDVTTALVRAGLDAPSSASVQEALETLAREAPLPTPLGLSRWIGRLRDALERGQTRRAARLLDGASRLADALREQSPGERQRAEISAWLGPHQRALRRISDRRLVEVGRESLSGRGRGGIQRRHLVDLSDGKVYREERSRAAPQASVGPCPRVVEVGLAEIEPGIDPTRIRLMQYGVELLGPEGALLTELLAHAYTDLATLEDSYRRWMEVSPGIAEPFVLLAPTRIEGGAELSFVDPDGRRLPVARGEDPAGAELLKRLCAAAEPSWVAGRLIDEGGRLELLVCSAVLPTESGHRLVNIR